MDIQDTREQRLAQVLEKQFGGSIARLADRVDREPSYFSRVFSSEGKAGKKRIGERLARDIEAKLGLPRLWLDGSMEDAAAPSNDEILPPGVAIRVARLVKDLRNEDIDRLLTAIELLMQVEGVRSVRKYGKGAKQAQVLTTGRRTATGSASGAVHESGARVAGKQRGRKKPAD
ncbi:hypothetical protein UB46_13415 [Burkholderiaceae bacterium 16]|nr:hypothetical protein UB46_13415 [Burkholderiaceae bacterium 16]